MSTIIQDVAPSPDNVISFEWNHSCTSQCPVPCTVNELTVIVAGGMADTDIA